MNKELYLVFLPGISWILFALGGTQISDKVPGQKWIRRYLLPLVYGIFIAIAGYTWQAVAVAVLAALVYILGYGDKTPIWKKVLVGMCYGLISIPLGISWWNPITALGFLSLFLLSNTKATANTFTWKVCEGTFGALVGIQIAYLLAGMGRLLWQ